MALLTAGCSCKQLELELELDKLAAFCLYSYSAAPAPEGRGAMPTLLTLGAIQQQGTPGDTTPLGVKQDGTSRYDQVSGTPKPGSRMPGISQLDTPPGRMRTNHLPFADQHASARPLPSLIIIAQR